MNIYKNLGGNSNVSGYEISSDRIIVMFNGGATYLYTNESTGVYDIAQMKSHAIRGIGLNSYIGRIVRKRFAVKLA